MENSNSYQTKPQAQRTAKILGIGCGAISGIFFCAALILLPLTFRPLIRNLDPFLIEFSPLLVTVIILTVAIIGAILGGVGGYFLFFKLAFKGSANRRIAQQRAFDQAVENAVEKKLQEREDRA